MTVRDLSPEQRRELLAAWDRAVAGYRNHDSDSALDEYQRRLYVWFIKVAIAFEDGLAVVGPARAGKGL